jgi:hypothetical protein
MEPHKLFEKLDLGESTIDGDELRDIQGQGIKTLKAKDL